MVDMLIDIALGIATIYTVFRYVMRPRASRRAPPSGMSDEPLKHWPNGPQDLER